MSIFKGITKNKFIKDYDEKDGLPFFMMSDFEELQCDEKAKHTFEESLRKMYSNFVAALNEKEGFYSFIESFYSKNMDFDKEKCFRFTDAQKTKTLHSQSGTVSALSDKNH